MRQLVIGLCVLFVITFGTLSFLNHAWSWSPRLDTGMQPHLIQPIWEPETADGTLYRWTHATSRIEVPSGTLAVTMLLRARDTTQTEIQLASGGTVAVPLQRERRLITVFVPAQTTTLSLVAPTFAAPGDGRPLGVIIEQLQIQGNWNRLRGYHLSLWLMSIIPLLAVGVAWGLPRWRWLIAGAALLLIVLLVWLSGGWLVRNGASVLATGAASILLLRLAQREVYGWMWGVPIGTICLAFVFAFTPHIPAHLVWALRPFALLPHCLTALLPAVLLLAGMGLLFVPSIKMSIPRWVWLLLGALIVGGTASIWPVRRVEGDGLTILGYIQSGMVIHWKQPGDFWLHAMVYRLLDGFVSEPARMSYRILSTLAGFAYGALAADCAWHWTQSFGRRCIVFMMLICGGFMVLFAGYIESYALVTTALLAYTWSSYLALEYGRSLWYPGLYLGLAIILHPVALWAVPSLLLWAYWRGIPSLMLSLGAMFIPIACVISTFTVAGFGPHTIGANNDAPGGYDGSMFVPLQAANGVTELYTLWSGAHIVAWLNALILAAPILLAVPALIQPWRGSFDQFLHVLVLGAIAWAFVWNPDLGPQQDWDLFSVAGLPIMLLAAWILSRLSGRLLRLVAPAWLGLCLINLLSWLMIHRIEPF